jgi:hypothetical protein
MLKSSLKGVIKAAPTPLKLALILPEVPLNLKPQIT